METTFSMPISFLEDFKKACNETTGLEIKNIVESPIFFNVTIKYEYDFNLFFLGWKFGKLLNEK